MSAKPLPVESVTTVTKTPHDEQRTELCAPITLTIPGRWVRMPGTATREEVIGELTKLVHTLSSGAKVLSGLYMRVCDMMRNYNLSDDDIRTVLRPHFSNPRICDFLKIVHSPDEVYRKYRGGFIGFRATIEQCRTFLVPQTELLKTKRVRRVAARLLFLMNHQPCEIRTLGFKVMIVKDETEVSG